MRLSRSAWVVIVCTAIYVVAFSVFTIGRHDRYNSTAYDLSFYDQVIWNTAHGRFMALSLIGPGGNNWMSHVEPILLTLVPVKWILSDVRWMLVAQTVVLALGAWPTYRIAHRRTGRPPVAALIAVLYLLYPVIGWANKFDIHPLMFTPVLLLTAYDLYETGRMFWLSLCLLLAMFCKEEMGLIVAMFGLYVAVKSKRWRFGLAWAAVGIGWSLLSFLVIIPTAQAASIVPIQGWASERYGWLFHGDLASKIAYITGPDTVVKIRFLFQLLLPLAFLPLLRLDILIVGAPSLGLALLSSSLNQSGIFHQYMLPVVPFLIIAAIFALEPAQRYLTNVFRRLRLRTRPGFGERLALILTVTGTLLSFTIFNPFLFVPREPYSPIYGWEAGASVAALEKVKPLIEPTGCLVATNNIAAHYSDRTELYTPNRFDPPDCRYVLVDLADERYDPTQRKYLCDKLNTGQYSILAHEAAVVLLERRVSPSAYNGTLASFCK